MDDGAIIAHTSASDRVNGGGAARVCCIPQVEEGSERD
jgi:hypothetical protein